MPTGDRQLVGMLQQAIEESNFAWSLCLIGEDQSHKLAAHACNDPFYPVIQQSIESFSQRWKRVRAKLDGERFHYVSLGIGTGHKDRQILHDLLSMRPDLLYAPVDMSAEMLRLGMRESLKGVRIARRQVVPVQLDFAIEENLDELRTLMHRLVGDEPILFSLLGNTLANFEHDLAVLGKLTGLFRPQDRFLLEVATTEALGEESRKYARHELDGMLDAVGMRKLHGTHSGFASHLSAAHGFGMDLLLFAAGPPGSASRQRSNRADEIWSSA